eukprot:TRINITY_DN10667_c0_g1_i3.p1 TRINITY_DN10667_c0_g1~~TRINITY_DN10667_c0_g1_i3.p1  ORF type:complete len:483 (+),score=147.92 TRINITY_DN10667_c0_g1_i3:182-1450(+)
MAVKKLLQPFTNLDNAKKVVREIRLLKHFQDQENVLGLANVFQPEDITSDQCSVYLVTDLLDTDLRSLLKTSSDLTSDHYAWFAYQIVSGVNAMHKAKVIHRDLKPDNIFVSKDCSLKIGDFGLARDDMHTTKSVYVVTRWYRAPELLLNYAKYNYTIDIWSVGCIIAEMLSVGHKALFPGNHYLDQLRLIINVIGTPSEDEFANVESVREYIKKLEPQEKKDLRRYPTPQAPYFPPSITDEELDFLFKCLSFSPADRPSAEDLLHHPYLEEYGDDEDEEEPIGVFDSTFEQHMTSVASCKEIFNATVTHYHPAYANRAGVQLHAVVTSRTAVEDAGDVEMYDAAGLTPAELSHVTIALLDSLDSGAPERMNAAISTARYGPEQEMIESVISQLKPPYDPQVLKQKLLDRFQECGYGIEANT